MNTDESDNNEELDVPGKKSKTNPRNNQKSLNSTPSNRVSNSNYNNIMLIKNEQIVSNSSSIKKSSSACRSVTHQVLDESVAERRQQQNPSSLGVSDRMSKEKQKFFRFSVFNKAKSKGSVNNSSNHNGVDAYKYVSSSDSEREVICDKAGKSKGKMIAGSRKSKTKSKKGKTRSSESSCCSSDGESGSSSGSSSSTSGSTSDTSSSSSSSCTNESPKTSLANKAESINTMNVFACINSRELTSQTKRPPSCWALPTDSSESLFKKKSRTFADRQENEVWGFAAEAKKSLNIFDASDSESRTRNFSGTESDGRLSLLSLDTRHRLSRGNRDAESSRFTQMPLKRTTASEFVLANRRTTTLMRNNAIMSSDDDAKHQLSPSKLFRKAASYKQFDNNALNNKKLIMDTSLNGAKYGSDERPVKEPQKHESPSKPPYNNTPPPICQMSDSMGKKLSSTLSL